MPAQTLSTPRILAASLAGTAIEFYDFFIYGTAASLVFGKLFFAAAPPSAQLMAAYASFSVAFLARPIGALAFGHFGDRAGRKSTLIASLLLMGLSTMAIGVLPTYAEIGWPAPVLLSVLRFGQGLGLGGEWGGAALLAIENAPSAFRGRFGMFPQLGAPVGFLAANGAFLLLGVVLTPAQFLAWGWRIPFLASAVLVGLGLWVRMRLTETPAFAAALAEARPPRVPAATLVRSFSRQTLAGTFAVVAAFAIFYLTTTFSLGYATTVLGYDRGAFLAVLLAAIPFLAAGILYSGLWSDRTDPRRVLIIGCAVAIPVGLLFAPSLTSGSLVTVWLFLSIALFVMGLVYGPLGAWMPSLFPARVRYTGVSVAFTVGGILGGGIAPIVAQSLAINGGLWWVGFYLSTAALVSLVALLTLGRPPVHPGRRRMLSRLRSIEVSRTKKS
ncbi:MAG: MFS transporter [Pseudomonadota bacterium]|nr:MFS transporter [Pseudomonadota bacterium]